MIRLSSKLISTFLGIGYSPLAPGTMGSIAATILYWYFLPTGGFVWLLMIIILSFIGVAVSSVTEKEFQEANNDKNAHDPSIIVFDEVAGVLFALFGMAKELPWVLAALILFRLFDIIKPFPVNKFEKLPGGWGIMLDDIVAGILANVILQIVLVLV